MKKVLGLTLTMILLIVFTVTSNEHETWDNPQDFANNQGSLSSRFTEFNSFVTKTTGITSIDTKLCDKCTLTGKVITIGKSTLDLSSHLLKASTIIITNEGITIMNGAILAGQDNSLTLTANGDQEINFDTNTGRITLPKGATINGFTVLKDAVIDSTKSNKQSLFLISGEVKDGLGRTVSGHNINIHSILPKTIDEAKQKFGGNNVFLGKGSRDVMILGVAKVTTNTANPKITYEGTISTSLIWFDEKWRLRADSRDNTEILQTIARISPDVWMTNQNGERVITTLNYKVTKEGDDLEIGMFYDTGEYGEVSEGNSVNRELKLP